MKNRSGFGWAELLEGILLIVLGCYTLLRPEKALTGFILLYGIAALVMGIADILLFVRVERYTGFGPIISLISGTLSTMAGVMLLAYPGAGRWVLSLLFPLWFIAHCVSRLAGLNGLRLFAGSGHYYFSLVLNILGLVLGTLMLVDPGLSLLTARYLVSFYLILLGIDCIILAFSKLGSR